MVGGGCIRGSVVAHAKEGKGGVGGASFRRVMLVSHELPEVFVEISIGLAW